MEPPDRENAPIEARERSPLSDAEKHDITRTIDRAVANGVDDVDLGERAVLPGCSVALVVGAERIEIRLRYDAHELPGPVVVPGAEEGAPPLVDDGGTPTAFVSLSAAHDALYEDLTDAAGHGVEPYAVAVPDTPVARSASEGTVTFVATLRVFTGDGSADRRTLEW